MSVWPMCVCFPFSVRLQLKHSSFRNFVSSAVYWATLIFVRMHVCMCLHTPSCFQRCARWSYNLGFCFLFFPSVLECKLQGAIEPPAYLAMLLVCGRDPSRLMWSSPILGSVTGTAWSLGPLSESMWRYLWQLLRILSFLWRSRRVLSFTWYFVISLQRWGWGWG